MIFLQLQQLTIRINEPVRSQTRMATKRRKCIQISRILQECISQSSSNNLHYRLNSYDNHKSQFINKSPLNNYICQSFAAKTSTAYKTRLKYTEKYPLFKNTTKGDVTRSIKLPILSANKNQPTKICRLSCKNRPILSADKIVRFYRPT